MKYLAIIVLFVLVGKISTAPRPAFSPKYDYRINRDLGITGGPDESAEDEQSDEVSVEEEEDDEPQRDDISEEVDGVKPPKFQKLFPAPQSGHGRPSAPQNFAFNNLMHEIDENGWKQPKKQPKPSARSALPSFRDDDDEDSEEEDEEDDQDDDAGAPDYDKMFPNPEGKPSGPTNLPESSPLSEITGTGPAIAGQSGPGGIDGLSFRSMPFGSTEDSQEERHSEGPVYVRRKMSMGPKMSSRPMAVSYVQAPYYYGGNRRVMSVPMSYKQVQVQRVQPSYSGSRRVVQMPMGYRPRQPQSSMSMRPMSMSMKQMSMRPMPMKQMSMRPMSMPMRQVYMRPMSMSNYGQRQQYSPVRRTVPMQMAYVRRPVKQQMPMRMQTQQMAMPMQKMQYYTPYSSEYGMRRRRNGRFWANYSDSY